MREIKLRAWDQTSKAFIKEYARTGAYGELYVSQLHSSAYGKTAPNLIIEQYTGLKDKNRKDIYEGDIVECYSAYTGVFKGEIVFQDGCFEIQESQVKDGVFRDYLKCLTCNHAAKVIGNIHENPELLTVAFKTNKTFLGGFNMNQENKYNLTFSEALDYVLNDHGWVQGEDFSSGIILCLNNNILSVYDFRKYENPMISKKLVSQKFRKVNTQQGANK